MNSLKRFSAIVLGIFLVLLYSACHFDPSGIPCDYFAISSGDPPDGCLGHDYYFVMIADNCNQVTADISWSIHYGTLPPGITLDGDQGVMSGVPAQNGTYEVWIQASHDPANETYVEQYFITIGTVAITTPGQLPAFCPGDAYEYQLSACGGSGDYSWSILDPGNLPASITLNSIR
jgi:hypothetical protein